MASELEREAQAWIKKVNGLTKEFSSKERKKILRRSARPLRKAAKRFTPVRKEPPGLNRRYATAKVLKGIKAPKGKGKVVAKYPPGWLRKSIAILTYRRTSDVFVGPRLRGRFDGYYAPMRFGDSLGFYKNVMRPALRATQSAVLSIIEERSRKKIEEYKRKNRL